MGNINSEEIWRKWKYIHLSCFWMQMIVYTWRHSTPFQSAFLMSETTTIIWPACICTCFVLTQNVDFFQRKCIVSLFHFFLWMYVVVDGLELIASLDFSTSMYKCVWEVDMMDISKGGKNNTWILLLISEFYPVKLCTILTICRFPFSWVALVISVTPIQCLLSIK